MSIELNIDAKSFDNFQKQMDILLNKGETSLYKVVCMIAMRIKTSAQLRLKGQGHNKTTRLTNSIYMQAKDQSRADQYAGGKNPATYSADGKTYSSKMSTLGLTDNEIAVGTNVEYAASMEMGARPHEIRAKNKKALAFMMGGVKVVRRAVWHPGYKGDSYLEWAIQNADLSEAFAKEMRNEMKFGPGVAAQQVKGKK